MRSIKELFKFSFITITMGILYMVVELLYRGYTFWQMFIVGGITGMLIGLINKVFSWGTPLWLQGLIGMLLCTTLEFISGVYLNLYLHLNIWNYFDMPFNLYGQICLYFSICWYLLSFIAIFVDDFVRWKLFGEEKPIYKIF